MTASATATTKETAQQWFRNLEDGDFEAALALVDEHVHWENIPPVTGVSDVAPWLGTYDGLPAVLESFDVWAAHSRMLSFRCQKLICEGEDALGIVHEHAQCIANGNEYDLYVATHLKVVGGRIHEWKVYWDISPLVRAYKDL